MIWIIMAYKEIKDIEPLNPKDINNFHPSRWVAWWSINNIFTVYKDLHPKNHTLEKLTLKKFTPVENVKSGLLVVEFKEAVVAWWIPDLQSASRFPLSVTRSDNKFNFFSPWVQS